MARVHAWNRVTSIGGIAGMLVAAVVAGLVADGPLLPTMFVAMAALLAFAHSMGSGMRVADSKERERLRERVRRAKAKQDVLRGEWIALADGLDDALFVCNPKGIVQFANQRALGLFGFDTAEGKSILAVTLSHDIEKLVSETADSGVEQRIEVELHLATPLTVVARAWPGHGEKVLLGVRDLTDLRRLERVRRDFVANVSHELRTPLSVIRALAETLQDDPEAEALKSGYLGKIVSEVDRLTMISSDLLVLSGAESRAVDLQECDVAAVFRSAVEQLRGKAESKGLKLAYHGPEHIQIQANPTQLAQVAANLIENALNYTTEGRVDVTLEERESVLKAEVKDTGLGIAIEHQPRIWERFYRVDKGRSRSTGGTGLGLSIVRNIIEAHGGNVSVESALNEGSAFRIELPR